jgi:transforming growth factor-beta-induced protein
MEEYTVKIKQILAGVLLATVAITAAVPAAASAHGGRHEGRNIVERLVAVNDRTDAFDTLIAAATCEAFDGAIVDALANTPDITLFAPTDHAFRKLGRDLGIRPGGLTPANICTVDAGVLADILTYHVLPGRVTYAQALAAARTVDSVTMLNGDEAHIAARGYTFRIDGAKVIWPNIRASNGIIHVVEAVLTPPAE